MNNILKSVKEKATSAKYAIGTAVMTTALSAGTALSAFAEDTTATEIAVNFDTSQMFTFANVIIESMMPVVYITAGLGLGFMIINSLKAAFR